MKLAEALINRADAQKRAAQIRERLVRSARIQEGEKPPEDPNELLKELDRVLTEMARLVKDINHTNTTTELKPGMTLTDALAERDRLMLERSILGSLIEAAAVSQFRSSRSEVKYFSTIDIKATQKQFDNLARQHRELDSQIQASNWVTELIEK
jgi:hypothetical protein